MPENQASVASVALRVVANIVGAGVGMAVGACGLSTSLGLMIGLLLVAILCLPLPLCLGIGFGWEPLLPLLALLPNLVALALGAWALRDTQMNPRISGQAMAVTGMLTGALASVLSVLLTIYPAFALS